MNARVRKMLEGAIQSDGIEELFETGKHISVDIFSDEDVYKRQEYKHVVLSLFFLKFASDKFEEIGRASCRERV